MDNPLRKILTDRFDELKLDMLQYHRDGQIDLMPSDPAILKKALDDIVTDLDCIYSMLTFQMPEDGAKPDVIFKLADA